MKKIILVICFLMVSSTVKSEIQLTDDQFKNLDIIREKISEKDSEFKGFIGTKNNLRVIGISDEQALDYMRGINVNQEVSERKNQKDNLKNEIKKDLEDAGLSEQTIKFLVDHHMQDDNHDD